jgi:hypothetical protein
LSNAQLIAASPDLLNTLIDIKDYLEKFLTKDIFSIQITDADVVPCRGSIPVNRKTYVFRGLRYPVQLNQLACMLIEKYIKIEEAIEIATQKQKGK